MKAVADEGMQHFDGEIAQLVRDRVVDLEVGISFASNPAVFGQELVADQLPVSGHAVECGGAAPDCLREVGGSRVRAMVLPMGAAPRIADPRPSSSFQDARRIVQDERHASDSYTTEAAGARKPSLS